MDLNTETPSSEVPEVEAQPAATAEPAAAASPVAEEPRPVGPITASGEAHSGDLGWYVVHTYSGYENKVQQNLPAKLRFWRLPPLRIKSLRR